MAKAAKPSKTKSKPAATGRALVTFLLDRSGSMDSIRIPTIKAFNEYLGGLRADNKAEIDFTFLQFDTQSIDKVHVCEPVRKVPNLTIETFVPRGGTPLIDAAMKTILATEEALKKRGDKPRVVMCFQTDGEENSSRDHTWEGLKVKIEQKKTEGWEFNFMGAGIDSYQQGARMGISVCNTISYDSRDLGSTMRAFAGSASNTVRYARGLSGSTAYSSHQKMAAGDRFDPTRRGRRARVLLDIE